MRLEQTRLYGGENPDYRNALLSGVAPEAASNLPKSNTVEPGAITRVSLLSLRIVPIENLFIEHLQWKREAPFGSGAYFRSQLHTAMSLRVLRVEVSMMFSPFLRLYSSVSL
jgi:hypothetical protein